MADLLMLCDGWQAFGRQKVEPEVKEETPGVMPEVPAATESQ